MGTITLHPGRLVVTRWPGDEATVWPASASDFLPYLLYTVELGSDFTLGDLFRLVDREDVGLLAELLDENVLPVLEEARQGTVESDDDEPLRFLRVSNRHEDGCLRRELDAWGTWHQPYADADGEAGPHETSISVSLTPIGQLLDVPIRYDPELLFRNRGFEVEYTTSIDITFIEFLKAVFDDLTFHGVPEERDQMLRTLKRQVEQIEREEVRLIPHEEVARGLRNKIGSDDA